MSSEKSKKQWSISNTTVNDTRPLPLTYISRNEAKNMVRYDNQDGVQRVVRDTCEVRYNLARKAPIMNSKLAFLADAETMDITVVEDIVEGRHPIPNDLDMATKLYIEEIVRIARMNPFSFEKKAAISSKNFVYFWSKVNEHTQSSDSEHHCGTYKAAARDET